MRRKKAEGRRERSDLVVFLSRSRWDIGKALSIWSLCNARRPLSNKKVLRHDPINPNSRNEQTGEGRNFEDLGL
jgi:hypothetical protein